jgi:hypothetical protein
LVQRISSDLGWQEAFFFGPDDRIRVDADKLLRAASEMLARVVFPSGDDAELQREIAQINAAAFAGSRFGHGANEKYLRNRALSRRHPLCFALLRGPDGQPPYHGLVSTIPLDQLDNVQDLSHIAAQGGSFQNS